MKKENYYFQKICRSTSSRVLTLTYRVYPFLCTQTGAKYYFSINDKSKKKNENENKNKFLLQKIMDKGLKEDSEY